MKKIILTILSFLFTNLLIAQFPPYGTTVANNDLNKFVGTWQWVSTSDTITFKLTKENIAPPGKGGMDYIIGYHSYKNGTNTVESSMQYGAYSYISGYTTIIGLEATGSGFKTLRVRTHDISKNKDDNFDLTLNSDNTQMQCTRVIVAGGVRFGTPPPPGFTLPQSFLLVKLPPPPPPPPPVPV